MNYWPRACASLGVTCVTLALFACTPDCSGLVGLWATEYNGEKLSFEIRAGAASLMDIPQALFDAA